MKKINILYWVFTILAAGLMFYPATLPYLLNTKETQDFMVGFLHYPAYMIPFLGWAKMLGILGILLPVGPRIKEWAYAGLIFDLVGATYSCIAAAGKFDILNLFMLVWILPVILSYIFYHKKLKATAEAREVKGNYKMA